MIAASIDAYGSNQVLRLGERPAPICGPRDVLIKILAASVNPVDFKVRDGKIRFLRPYSFPLILGHDGAGEIVQVGAGVAGFQVGDRVFTRPRNGRIGTFAIQLAKHLGAEVWTTTSVKNAEFVKGLGADHVIDYRRENFAEVLGRQLDVVFDTLGGEALKRSFRVVKPGGIVVSISGAPDHRTARELGLGPLKSLVLGAVGWPVNQRARRAGARYRFIFMHSSGDQLTQIARLVEQNIIRPVLDKVFPLQEAQSALEYSESGRARGKIVIQINP